MSKFFIVTVVAQLLSEFGEVSTTVAEQYVPVKAQTPEMASIAAVRWFGDNSTVYNANKNPFQQPISSTHDVSEECGHAIMYPTKNLRYVSVRALLISQDEIDAFFSMTCGLLNGRIVEAE